jgi:DNA-3-methyladenine glycosylase II
MPEKQEKMPENFWHEGPVSLADLPEIGKGLRHLVKNHPELATVYAREKPLPWKRQPDGFEGLVRIILAQQVSTASAASLIAKLYAGLPEVTPRRFLKLDDTQLRAMGFSRQKIAYCRDLAERIAARKFDPGHISDMADAEAFAVLMDLKGIGFWSAEIYLMFCLGRGDIWPAGDLGLQNRIKNMRGLRTRPETPKTRKIGEIWAPYRSAAALIVWRA